MQIEQGRNKTFRVEFADLRFAVFAFVKLTKIINFVLVNRNDKILSDLSGEWGQGNEA